MTNEGKPAPLRQRVIWLDNLRTFAIFLVVVMHAGVVYESSGIGAIFWIVDDPSTNDLIGIVNLVLDLFVMPTIFFVSGYLAPISLVRSSGWSFVKARFIRLMVPWGLAVFTLMPLYKVIFLYSRGLPQEHWTTYFHFSNGILSQNWLWFLPVLFLFDLVYALLATWRLVPIRTPFPLAVPAAFFVSLTSSVAFDMLGAEGWTKTLLLDFQNERLLVYLAIFLLGPLGFEQDIFGSGRVRTKIYIAVSSVAWIPVGVYTVLLVIWLLRPGFVLVSPLIGSIVFWLSYCLSVLSSMYLVVETFRLYANKPGWIWTELARNSYPVYIIHVIVLGAIALILLGTSLPALLKYVTLALSTYLASNLVASSCRRVLNPGAEASHAVGNGGERGERRWSTGGSEGIL